MRELILLLWIQCYVITIDHDLNQSIFNLWKKHIGVHYHTFHLKMASSGLVSKIEVTEDFLYYPGPTSTSRGSLAETEMTVAAAKLERDQKQKEVHSIIEKTHLLNIMNSQAYSCYPGSCCCIEEEGRRDCSRPEVYTCCNRHYEVLQDLQRQVEKRNKNREFFRNLDSRQERLAWHLDYKEVNVMKKFDQPISLCAGLQKIFY